MDYFGMIIETFEKHKISIYSELKYRELSKSENYPSSEGITFESADFTGEIFYYSNEAMEYCEMEFLIFDSEKSFVKIIDKPNKENLKKSISEFLTVCLNELKNVF